MRDHKVSKWIHHPVSTLGRPDVIQECLLSLLKATARLRPYVNTLINFTEMEYNHTDTDNSTC